jgi:hypothetical protein
VCVCVCGAVCVCAAVESYQKACHSGEQRQTWCQHSATRPPCPCTRHTCCADSNRCPPACASGSSASTLLAAAVLCRRAFGHFGGRCGTRGGDKGTNGEESGQRGQEGGGEGGTSVRKVSCNYKRRQNIIQIFLVAGRRALTRGVLQDRHVSRFRARYTRCLNCFRGRSLVILKAG